MGCIAPTSFTRAHPTALGWQGEEMGCIAPTSFTRAHLLTLSPCHRVTVSPCHLVTVSSPCPLGPHLLGARARAFLPAGDWALDSESLPLLSQLQRLLHSGGAQTRARARQRQGRVAPVPLQSMEPGWV